MKIHTTLGYIVSLIIISETI